MNMSPEEREEAMIDTDDIADPNDIPNFTEDDILALLSEEERLEYQQDQQLELSKAAKRQSKQEKRNPLLRYQNMKARRVLLFQSVFVAKEKLWSSPDAVQALIRTSLFTKHAIFSY